MSRQDRIEIVIGMIPPTLRSPMLAPTWVPFPQQIDWPVRASEKINGVRNLVFPGHGSRSREGCTWRSEHLSGLEATADTSAVAGQLAAVQAIADRFDVVLDGEFWAPNLTPRDLQEILSRRDGIVEGLQYFIFDLVDFDEYNGESVTPFDDRHRRALELFADVSPAIVIEQQLIGTWDELCPLYRQVRSAGGEGLIIRRPHGLYHHGRCSMESRQIFKIKPLHANSHQSEIPSGLEV